MHIKVYVAEAEGIPEYGTTTTLGKRLVAVKFLLPEASEKEKWVYTSIWKPEFAFCFVMVTLDWTSMPFSNQFPTACTTINFLCFMEMYFYACYPIIFDFYAYLFVIDQPTDHKLPHSRNKYDQ